MSFSSPNYANMMAYIKLSSWLGEVSETLYVTATLNDGLLIPYSTLLRNCPKRFIPEYLDRLIQLRMHIGQWWDSLPSTMEYRDTTPDSPLFRQNSHLKMTYLLIYVYMGRPFMFASDWTDSPIENADSDPRTLLVQGCVKSALEILDTLHSLSTNTGLCRASYTEFSSCRAALLVILAERLNSRKLNRFQGELSRGMAMIRRMTGGSSSESEISYLQSLDAAIRQSSLAVNETGSDEHSLQDEPSAYAQFKHWTNAMKQDTYPGGITDLELSSFSPLSFLNSEPRLGEGNEVQDLLNTWPSEGFVMDPNVFSPLQTG